MTHTPDYLSVISDPMVKRQLDQLAARAAWGRRNAERLEFTLSDGELTSLCDLLAALGLNAEVTPDGWT